MTNSTDYPTVELSFLLEQIKKAPTVELATQVGGTYWYIIKGTKPIMQRSTLIREISKGVVSYQFASGCAIKLKFLPELMEWLEKNRKWKDGGYIV